MDRRVQTRDQQKVGDSFTLYAPSTVDILKGASDEKRLIGGFCSTERLDRQGEVVLQRGLDFHEFIHYGYFNDNHKPDTDAVVGVPFNAKFVKGKGWWTDGELLKGFPRADNIWSLAKSLEGTSRKLGFSIEGKVLERRNSYQIAKAKVRMVAVTNSPVNTDCTWGILAKAFCANPGVPEDECQCCVENAEKSVRDEVIVNPGIETEILSPIVDPSMEKGELKHVFTCPIEDCHRSFMNGHALDIHLQRHDGGVEKAENSDVVIRRSATPLSFVEAVNRVRQIRGYSEPLARRVVQFAISRARASQ